LADKAMNHLNGHLLCGVELNTTGPNPLEHELYQISIIPLDRFYKRSKDMNWLELTVVPGRYDNIVNGRDAFGAKKAVDSGIDYESAMMIFDHWWNSFDFAYKKGIAPLSHNWPTKERFLRKWMGDLNFESKFAHDEMRDIESIMRFLNDLQDSRCEKFMINKAKRAYMAYQLGVYRNYGRERTATAKAAIDIDIYRGLQGMISQRLLPYG